MKKYCFGVDVGGTTVKVGLFTVEGQLDDDAEYEDVWWTIKMNNKNQIMPSTVVKFELITDWQIW